MALETPRSSSAATKAVDNIGPIIALARDGTEEQKEHAAKVLLLLAMKTDLRTAVAKAAIPCLLGLAYGRESPTISNHALTALLNLADLPANKLGAVARRHENSEWRRGHLPPSRAPTDLYRPAGRPAAAAAVF